MRFGDLAVRGALPRAFALSLEAVVFWIETACFLAPFALIGREAQRRNPARLFVAGILLLLAGSMLRMNGFLVGYDSGPGFRRFPVLPREAQ